MLWRAAAFNQRRAAMASPATDKGEGEDEKRGQVQHSNISRKLSA